MRRLFTNANYDFIGWRKRAYTASTVLLLLGLVFAIYNKSKYGSVLHYGVDFTGGSAIRVAFTTDTDEAELRSLLTPELPGTQVTRFVGTQEFEIRTPVEGDEATKPSDVVKQILTQRFGAAYEQRNEQAVSAKVGSELQQKAIIAILISLAATLVYLAFRFEWRFGLAAVLATAHDVALTLAFVIIFRLDVSLDAVAALLTIVGYSLNDTVIIFDRIRENIKGKRIADLTEVLNRSINETLPRTTLTVTTTLATLFALFLLGGDIIRVFAEILIVGILLGAYSSIFVASPALRAIEKKWPRPAAIAKTSGRTSRSTKTAGVNG